MPEQNHTQILLSDSYLATPSRSLIYPTSIYRTYRSVGFCFVVLFLTVATRTKYKGYPMALLPENGAGGLHGS